MNTLDSIKFKGIHLSVEARIVLFWIFISWVSLLLKWVDSTEWVISGGAFSALSWSCWYILTILMIISSIIILSYSKKEKFKMSIDFHFQDHNIILTSWIIIILFSITTLRYINGLQSLSSGIIYWKWPIIAIIWGILIFTWGILMKKRKMEKSWGIYISEISDSDEEITGENNMKLPF